MKNCNVFLSNDSSSLVFSVGLGLKLELGLGYKS